MRSLAPYLVTLPLLATPACQLWTGPALAQTVSADQALTYLARSHAADAKCRYLNPGERQELADYLAKAEVAETGRSSSANAQSIIAAGRAQGRGVVCNPASGAEVKATLAASREALARGDRPRRKVVAEVSPPQQRPKKQRGKPTGRLASYGEQAMAYYVERRCNFLSAAEARSFWNHIVAAHAVALKSNGRRAVAAMLKGAEAEAAGRACGRRSAALVEAAFSAL